MRQNERRQVGEKPKDSLMRQIVLVTLLALLVFGYIKGLFTTGKPVRSAIQTVVVGGLAASAAFLIAKALG